MFKIAALAVGDVERCPLTNEIRPKVFNMIRYCHSRACRRISLQQSIEGSHPSPLEEETCIKKKSRPISSSSSCSEEYTLCDNCQLVPSHAIDEEELSTLHHIFKVIIESISEHEKTSSSDQKSTLTLNKLMNTKSVKMLLKELKKTASTSRIIPSSASEMEFLVVAMIERYYMDLSIHFTPYSTLCYITSGLIIPSVPRIAQYLQHFRLKFHLPEIVVDRRPVSSKTESTKKKRVMEIVEEDDNDEDLENISRKRERGRRRKLSPEGETSSEKLIDLT